MSDFAPKEGNRPNSHFFKEKVVFLLQKHVQTPNNALQYHVSNFITYNKERACTCKLEITSVILTFFKKL